MLKEFPSCGMSATLTLEYGIRWKKARIFASKKSDEFEFFWNGFTVIILGDMKVSEEVENKYTVEIVMWKITYSDFHSSYINPKQPKVPCELQAPEGFLK